MNSNTIPKHVSVQHVLARLENLAPARLTRSHSYQWGGKPLARLENLAPARLTHMAINVPEAVSHWLKASCSSPAVLKWFHNIQTRVSTLADFYGMRAVMSNIYHLEIVL